jgi:hypothetical protein
MCCLASVAVNWDSGTDWKHSEDQELIVSSPGRARNIVCLFLNLNK